MKRVDYCLRRRDAARPARPSSARGPDSTVTGAAVGAGAGAAIGAGTGYGAKEGALIGTGVGAAAGVIYDITKN